MGNGFTACWWNSLHCWRCGTVCKWRLCVSSLTSRMWTTPILTSVCWKSLNRSAVIQTDSFSNPEGGVVEPHERAAINDELYLSISRSCRSMQHWSTKSFVSEMWRPQVCSGRRSVGTSGFVEKLTHEQFNNTTVARNWLRFLYRWKNERWNIAMQWMYRWQEIVTRSFAEVGCGGFQPAERTVLCDKVNRWFKRNHCRCPSRRSFVWEPETQRVIYLHEAMSMEMLIPLEQFRRKFREMRSVASTKLTGYVWDGCAASGMKLSSVGNYGPLADFQ